MNPDNVLGGHQWSELSMDTDTYYLQHGKWNKTTSKFVVSRDEDLVIINDSERMNKLSARMRWDYLMKEGWKRLTNE